MITFLLTLLILYLLYKLLPWAIAWWLRRKQRQFEQHMGEAYERSSHRQQAGERAQQRVSHIEDNAEDADYVEIAGPRETVVQETFAVEEQVVDAEFEDI